MELKPTTFLLRCTRYARNTWASYQSDQKQVPWFLTSKWNPLLQMGVQVSKGSLMLIKIPNVSQESESLQFISVLLISSTSSLRPDYAEETHCRLVSEKCTVWRWGGGGSGRGGHAAGRSSEGKNNKDNDHGHKFCCRHIKLSTHSLGRVSAGLEMKTFNPTVA